MEKEPRSRWLHLQRSCLARVYRKACRLARYRLRVPPSQRSSVALDIVIPLAEKDLPVVRNCVTGLRNSLLHEIRAIHLIAPDVPAIREAAAELGCLFVPEREILPEGPKAYEPVFAQSHLQRGSWLYQQFLKLAAGEILQLERFLVYDSDTVLINPFKYEFDGRWVLEFTEGYRSELDPLHRKLVPGVRLQPFSFMSHAMLMDTGVIAQLRQAIEAATGLDWKNGIIQSMELRNDVCFSEYELYGTYALHTRPRMTTTAYWFNKSYRRSDAAQLPELIEADRGRYRSLSFHSHSK